MWIKLKVRIRVRTQLGRSTTWRGFLFSALYNIFTLDFTSTSDLCHCRYHLPSNGISAIDPAIFIVLTGRCFWLHGLHLPKLLWTNICTRSGDETGLL